MRPITRFTQLFLLVVFLSSTGCTNVMDITEEVGEFVLKTVTLAIGLPVYAVFVAATLPAMAVAEIVVGAVEYLAKDDNSPKDSSPKDNSQNNSRRMYANKEGVEQSDQEALQEEAREQNKLGKKYASGTGVARKKEYDDIPRLLRRHKQVKVDKRKWLFVIGAGEYKETSDIQYSRRSADLFAKVASKVLGIAPSRSVVLLDKDATSGSIESGLRGMLRKVKGGDTLYFYYSGHGVPDPTDQNAPYMLATDHAPDFIHKNDYFKLENIYKTLSESGAKVVVFMDSCFTGRTDEESVFGSDKGAVRLKPEKLSIPTDGKLAVITAGTGEQFSNAFPSRRHRLFSYYLMKAMLGGHTKVSSLYFNVRRKVYRESLNLGGLKEQKPVFQGNRNLTL